MTTVALCISLILLAVATYRWRRSVRELGAAHTQKAESEDLLRLATSEGDYLRVCLGSARDGYLVVSEAGEVLTQNRTAVELTRGTKNLVEVEDDPANEGAGLGLSRDNFGARRLRLGPLLEEALAKVKSDGVNQTFRTESSDSLSKVLNVTVSRLNPPNSTVRLAAPACALVEIQDHSLLQRLESLRRDFVANVSHELKTPLAAIKGFVETILDDDRMPSDIRRRFLEKVHQQTERLATLVSDLLTLSRLDDDPGLRSGEPCNLLEVIADTLRDLAPIAENREIRLESTIPDDPVLIHGDRESLRQLVGNLVDNALKYTPERGTVTVQLSCDPGKARLEVADTGIGMSAGDQERVFERFYRVDRARSRELGGTGLGLSIVKNTALTLGGDIGVRSELGVGSMFWVELPTHA